MTLEISIVQLFFEAYRNTAQIARKLKLPEWDVDRAVSREIQRRYARERPV